ncbi:MAG: hypothetical protein CSB44_11525 [Gammaproteobacteria bacterium]|nr:MAG: hypothetical protein CSB44_11525 [Gammaproteobacteria bacterium]
MKLLYCSVCVFALLLLAPDFVNRASAAEFADDFTENPFAPRGFVLTRSRLDQPSVQAAGEAVDVVFDNAESDSSFLRLATTDATRQSLSAEFAFTGERSLPQSGLRQLSLDLFAFNVYRDGGLGTNAGKGFANLRVTQYADGRNRAELCVRHYDHEGTLQPLVVSDDGVIVNCERPAWSFDDNQIVDAAIEFDRAAQAMVVTLNEHRQVFPLNPEVSLFKPARFMRQLFMVTYGDGARAEIRLHDVDDLGDVSWLPRQVNLHPRIGDNDDPLLDIFWDDGAIVMMAENTGETGSKITQLLLENDTDFIEASAMFEGRSFLESDDAELTFRLRSVLYNERADGGVKGKGNLGEVIAMNYMRANRGRPDPFAIFCLVRVGEEGKSEGMLGEMPGTSCIYPEEPLAFDTYHDLSIELDRYRRLVIFKAGPNTYEHPLDAIYYRSLATQRAVAAWARGVSLMRTRIDRIRTDPDLEFAATLDTDSMDKGVTSSVTSTDVGISGYSSGGCSINARHSALSPASLALMLGVAFLARRRRSQ